MKRLSVHCQISFRDSLNLRSESRGTIAALSGYAPSKLGFLLNDFRIFPSIRISEKKLL
jgi:hypothetical protein